VGGTRTGVKCLHAHWAWHLAGGDDPVARWVADRIDVDEIELDGVHVDVRRESTVITFPTGRHASIPWGSDTLTQAWLVDADPPHPAGLTNALGVVADHLDDVEREHPEIVELARARGGVSFGGDTIASLARLELGTDDVPPTVALDRHAAEDIFRLVATESAADRAHNPGLPSEHVDTIVATCCVVLSVMRRFRLDTVTLSTGIRRGVTP
jgi:exopolyphosphatase/guanosine-5'-triphosphate,3'-diphosphate pyrophosphatase